MDIKSSAAQCMPRALLPVALPCQRKMAMADEREEPISNLPRTSRLCIGGTTMTFFEGRKSEKDRVVNAAREMERGER